MNVLGISCYFHDSAAALVRDGALVAAAEEERFSRRKHDARFPCGALAYCLEAGGITAEDVDYVAFFEKPLVKLERLLATCVATAPRSWGVFERSMLSWLSDKIWVKKNLQDALGFRDGRRFGFVGHHLSHAASSFLCSPFDEAAILTIDGVGEWSTATLAHGRGADITALSEMRFPHSLGLLYSTFTAFLGFEVNEGEYKVMGLAPYGEPRFVDDILKIVRVRDDGSFWLDMDYFAFHRSAHTSYSRRFLELFGPPRDPADADRDAGDGGGQRYADIAASIQRVTEDIVLKMARHAHARTGLRRLCLAGGVALNSVANGRIARELPFDELYVQPSAGDGGAALGAALYAHGAAFGKPRTFTLDHAYWGPAYSEADVRAELDRGRVKYRELSAGAGAGVAARLLADGKVIGWFQGRSEFGPRALGNRSILADPRREDMKAIVNAKVKFREPFRPFAPAVLAERASEFFAIVPGLRALTPFMLATVPVKPAARALLPAVTHVDGSARVQTVSRDTNPGFHDVIRAFGEATGMPVLMNTSFNVRGEPIVNTPREALGSFYKSGLDALVIDRFLVLKES